MGALRKSLFTVLLLAVWLVATQHCGLEAAGVFSSHSGEAVAGCCSTDDGAGCAEDDCSTVEGGLYRPNLGGVKAAAPELAACFCLLCSSRVLAPPETETRFTAHRPAETSDDWVPSWRFERRAAALAHAPDTLIA